MVGMQGPVCTDLHHSFVQRWNSAVVVEAPEVVCYPTPEQCNDLQFPTELFLAEGAEESLCRAQLQRSVCAANTWVSASAVDGSDFDIREGEASILEQYEKAIDHAKEVIYLENQHIAHASLLRKLEEALQRGVRVVYVAPGYVLPHRFGPRMAAIGRRLMACGNACSALMRSFHSLYRWFWKSIPEDNGTHPHHSHENSYASSFLHALPRLGAYNNFCVAGLVSPRTAGGTFRDISVHSKLMIVDDSFMTCGSANLVDLSMDKNHTEVNLSAWSTAVATSTREAIWREHLGTNECDGMCPRDAFERFAEIANDNAGRVERRESILLCAISVAMEARSCA